MDRVRVRDRVRERVRDRVRDIVRDRDRTASKDTAYTRWSCRSGMANPVQIPPPATHTQE